MSPEQRDGIRLPLEPAGMARWFDPRALVRAGLQVFISTLLGRHLDRRVMEASRLEGAGSCLHHDDQEELWLDYLADTGDGWDSTHAVAACATRPRLKVSGHDLPRGDLLVFGGDQVYPDASPEEYARRLVLPFEAATDTLGATAGSIHETAPTAARRIYSIPGNHDWYDSLAAFTELFLRKRRFADWSTCQERSYFALRLPGGWWLFAADVQLDNDMDSRQLEFFLALAHDVAPTERVVLAAAVPHWLESAERADYEQKHAQNVRRLEEELGDRLAACLAGDRHYYRRHETDQRQLIVAGGAGAFLHPTCDFPESGAPVPGARERAAWPSPRRCRWLSLRNLLFAAWNPRFVQFSGPLAFATAWLLIPNALRRLEADASWQGAWHGIAAHALDDSAPLLWCAIVIVGSVFFTESPSRPVRWIGGALHAVAQLALAVAVGVGASFAVNGIEPALLRVLSWAAVVTGIGGVGAASIMGLYLLTTLNLPGVRAQWNASFGALRIRDYKNFLRLRFRRSDRSLTIFPIGLPRVPRWRKRRAGGAWRVVPQGDPTLRPELIEEPIVLKAPSSG